MYADAVNCTHNGTGGSGTITLASVSGWPQPTDVFGTSGTMFVMYSIAEYTDSTLVTLSKYESGYGSLVLSTNVLTRTTVLKTWTSGGSYARTGASALTFGNTAANVRITLGASVHNVRGGLLKACNDGDNYTLFNPAQLRDSTIGSVAPVNGTMYYWSFEHVFAGIITTVAIEVATGESGKECRIGVYDVDTADGLPENLITEFTSATQISLTTGSAFASVTMGTPFHLPPGRYWMALQTNATGTGTIRQCTTATHSFMSGSGQRDTVYFTKASTYGALPAAALTSLTRVTKSASGGPWGVHHR